MLEEKIVHNMNLEAMDGLNREKNIVYINPQSYNNLALYDFKLLNNIEGRIVYCCSECYDAPLMDKCTYQYVFRYNTKKTLVAKGLSYLKSLYKVVGIIRKLRPDIVHIQWWRFWLVDYIALFLYKRYAKQVVYTAHNIIPHDTGTVMQYICRKYYNRVDKIIVHVQETKNELVKDYKISADKIYVIPHGILDFMSSESEVHKEYERLKEKYKLQNKIVVSFVGWQSRYKGIDLIKKVYLASEILQDSNIVFFIVAGKGDFFTKDMMNSHHNLLVYDEFVPSYQMEAVMEVTNILLLPYRKISQSGVLLTAINKEVPYLATNIGGLSEPLKIAPIGWGLNNCTETELRTKLEYLITHSEIVFQTQNNKRNWDKVKRYYDWTGIGLKTMKCYENHNG